MKDIRQDVFRNLLQTFNGSEILLVRLWVEGPMWMALKLYLQNPARRINVD